MFFLVQVNVGGGSEAEIIKVDKFLDFTEKPKKQDGGVIIRFDDHPDFVAYTMKVRNFEHGYLSNERTGQAPF